MIVEYIRYKISKEKQVAFENAYKKTNKILKSSPHCISYEMSHCVDDPDHYIIRIEWNSLEGHLKGFRTSPEFSKFFQEVKPFYDNIEEMKHYQVLDEMHK